MGISGPYVYVLKAAGQKPQAFLIHLGAVLEQQGEILPVQRLQHIAFYWLAFLGKIVPLGLFNNVCIPVYLS